MLGFTDLVEHRKPEEKKNPYYDGKYNRYKKNVKRPKVEHPEESEAKAKLREATAKFVQQEIDKDEYKNVLKSQGINPEIDGINKVIKSSNAGYTEMLNSIDVHKNDTSAKLRSFKVKNLEEDVGVDNAKNLLVKEEKKQ